MDFPRGGKFSLSYSDNHKQQQQVKTILYFNMTLRQAQFEY